jgi:uncharacterized protein
MPELILERVDNQRFISEYTAGRLVYGQTVYQHSVWIDSEGHAQPWRPCAFEDLQPHDLEPSENDKALILIIGTGVKQHLLNRHQQSLLNKMGIAYEVMSSDAACRSFNMIVSDKKPVQLALLIR